jgi:chromate transport protein ChrA
LLFPERAALFSRSHYGQSGRAGLRRGFTTIGLIQLDFVERFQWVSTKEFLDGIVMGQVTPGPIVITATFLGYKLAGFLGAAMATVAIFTSDFFILSLLIPYYDRLGGIKAVRFMEQGILAAFVGMLGLVLYNFGRTTFVDIPSILFAVGAFIPLLKIRSSLHPFDGGNPFYFAFWIPFVDSPHHGSLRGALQPP